jgi:hypothetical protein
MLQTWVFLKGEFKFSTMILSKLKKAAPAFQKANGGKENAFFFPPFAF